MKDVVIVMCYHYIALDVTIFGIVDMKSPVFMKSATFVPNTLVVCAKKFLFLSWLTS